MNSPSDPIEALAQFLTPILEPIIKRAVAEAIGKGVPATPTPAPQQAGLLRLPEVLKLVGVSQTTWLAGVRTGRFPASVKIGERAVAWRRRDIEAVINGR